MNDHESSIRPGDPSLRAGVLYGVAAFATWGLGPIYFKAVATVPPLEILAHRIVWSVALLALLVLFSRRWHEVRIALRTPATRNILLITTILVSGNWFTFIWAITDNHVLQASLGYYINPLVSVVLGMVFLKERLSRLGLVSILLAAIGVAFQIIQGNEVPGIALILAFSFGLYGLLRKVVAVDAMVGLTVETALLGPAALMYLFWIGKTGAGHFGTVSWHLTILLSCAGVITTLPLLWFTASARRLPLATVGFLQYLTPSFHFMLAVLVYDEAFRYYHAVTFGCIWIALAVYSYDMIRRNKKTSVAIVPHQ